MTNPVAPLGIYQPQQIPMTAHYVVQEGDSKRFAWSAIVATLRMQLSLVGIAIAAVALLTLMEQGVGHAVAFALLAAVGSAIVLPLVGLLSMRRMERILAALAGPGDRCCSRFGPETVNIEFETSCTTYRYSDVQVGRVTKHVVILVFAKVSPIPIPRALVPDETLTWLRSRR